VLFLRLITPAVLFPHKFGLIKEEEITNEGRRGLTIIGKILQTLANESEFPEPPFNASNRFIRSNLKQWRNYWFKALVKQNKLKKLLLLISFSQTKSICSQTGRDLLTGENSLMDDFSLDPQDLITKSNHNVYNLICSFTQSKQRELILKILNLEKQASELPVTKAENYSYAFKKFKVSSCSFLSLFHILRRPHTFLLFFSSYFQNSNIILSRMTVEIDCSVPQLYQRLGHHFDERSIMLCQSKVLHRYNENLSVRHAEYAYPWPFKRREYLTLDWSEIVEEENFAVLLFMSVDYSQAPQPLPFKVPELKKGNIMAEVYAGYILRAHPQNRSKCIVNFVGYGDPKGNVKYAPKGMIRTAYEEKFQRVYSGLLSLQHKGS
jgi:hypothetical protein